MSSPVLPLVAILALLLGPQVAAFAQSVEAPPQPPAIETPAQTPPPAQGEPVMAAPPVVAAAQGRRGVFLALPYLGGETHRGQGAQGFGIGFVAGALLGARLAERFSLNGELAIDLVNVKNASAGTQAARRELDLAVSPLLHLGKRALEVVVGPKLGLWFGNYQLTSGGHTLDSETARGLVGALNLGVFVPVNQGVSLGGMFSLVLKSFRRTCATPIGQAETCTPSPNLDAEKVVGFSGGALF